MGICIANKSYTDKMDDIVTASDTLVARYSKLLGELNALTDRDNKNQVLVKLVGKIQQDVKESGKTTDEFESK